MNPVTANALLKTLEEPPGDVRFVLADRGRAPAAAHHPQPLPGGAPWPGRRRRAAMAWLQEQGVAAAAAPALLRAAGGRPEDASPGCSRGRPGRRGLVAVAQGPWRRGDARAPGSSRRPARVDAPLQKLCHDRMARASGGRAALLRGGRRCRAPARPGALERLVALDLGRDRPAPSSTRSMRGLMLEDLVSQARIAPYTRADPMSTPHPTPRPSVIQLAIREKGALYAAYIPLFTDGGLFVPTTRDYRLGDDIYLLLSLPDDPQRYPVAGKVAWITPAMRRGRPHPGRRRALPDRREARLLKLKIEEILRHLDLRRRRRRPSEPPGLALRRSAPRMAFRLCHVRRFPLPPELSRNCTSDLPRIRAGHGRGAGRPRAVHLHHAGGVRRACTRWRCGYDNFWATVGVHPDNEGVREPTWRTAGRAGAPARAWWPSARPAWTTTAWANGAAWPTWSGSASAFASTSARRGACGKPLVIHTRSASRRHAGASCARRARTARRARPAASSTASPRPRRWRAPRWTWASTSRSPAS